MSMTFVTLPQPIGASTLSAVVTLAVTSTSSNVELTGAGGVVTAINDGAEECFLAFGDDDTVAALATGNGLSSIPIPPGARFCFVQPGQWLAVITATSTTTLRVLIGSGAFFG